MNPNEYVALELHRIRVQNFEKKPSTFYRALDRAYAPLNGAKRFIWQRRPQK